MAGVPMNSPMAQMVAMRLGQPQPVGTNQQMPTRGAPDQGSLIDPRQMQQEAQGDIAPGALSGSQSPANGQMDPLAMLDALASQKGNEAALVPFLQELQKLYPKLKLADLKNGEAEMSGPTQEQFLGSVLAKHRGAKVHHVQNKGKGQRLHVRF